MSDDDGGAAAVEGDGGLAEVESTRTLFVEVTHATDRYWQLPRSILLNAWPCVECVCAVSAHMPIVPLKECLVCARCVAMAPCVRTSSPPARAFVSASRCIAFVKAH